MSIFMNWICSNQNLFTLCQMHKWIFGFQFIENFVNYFRQQWWFQFHGSNGLMSLINSVDLFAMWWNSDSISSISNDCSLLKSCLYIRVYNKRRKKKNSFVFTNCQNMFHAFNIPFGNNNRWLIQTLNVIGAIRSEPTKKLFRAKSLTHRRHYCRTFIHAIVVVFVGHTMSPINAKVKSPYSLSRRLVHLSETTHSFSINSSFVAYTIIENKGNFFLISFQ